MGRGKTTPSRLPHPDKRKPGLERIQFGGGVNRYFVAKIAPCTLTNFVRSASQKAHLDSGEEESTGIVFAMGGPQKIHGTAFRSPALSRFISWLYYLTRRYTYSDPSCLAHPKRAGIYF